jgi:FO synthase
MNESITRAAGATHGEEMPPERMEMLIRSAGSVPWQRTTLYGAAPGSRIAQSFSAPALEVTVNTPLLAARKRHSPSNTHAFGGV